MQKQRPAYDTDAVGAHEGRSPSPVGVTVRTETMDKLRALLDDALGALNEQQREIILLFHQQNWAIIEIAQHLNMPEGTVKSHLHRARKRMRHSIASDATLHARAREVWA
jgi:RNA polymerase sigma-70 factor (ECF subfamily)